MRVGLSVCACISEDVCGHAYAFLCNVGVRVSECMMARPRVNTRGPFCLRRGRQSKHRRKLWYKQSNQRLPWDTRQRGGLFLQLNVRLWATAESFPYCVMLYVSISDTTVSHSPADWTGGHGRRRPHCWPSQSSLGQDPWCRRSPAGPPRKYHREPFSSMIDKF